MQAFLSFSDHARLWLFQSTVDVSDRSTALERHLGTFTQHWLSHGVPVRGAWTLLYNHIIAIVADEQADTVSGCSTDGLMRTIHALADELGVDLFNRLQCGLLDARDAIHFVSLSNVKTDNLPGEPAALRYFNLTPVRLGQIRQNWPIALLESGIKIKPLALC